MENILICVGKNTDKWFKSPIEEYLKRISHYSKFNVIEIPDIKNSSKIEKNKIRNEEGTKILSQLQSNDYVVLLDEKGAEHTSQGFARWIEQTNHKTFKRLVFVIGGPFGFSEEVYERADYKISLSQMTFTHNMVRLFFIEQFYRAMTIIRGESYHH